VPDRGGVEPPLHPRAGGVSAGHRVRAEGVAAGAPDRRRLRGPQPGVLLPADRGVCLTPGCLTSGRLKPGAAPGRAANLGPMLPATVARWRAEGRWIRAGVGSVFVGSASGRGSAVVLLHGYPSSSYDYRAVLPELGDRGWVTFDFLGFGLSDKPRPHRYSLFEQADLVQTVVRSVTDEPVLLIAHDMGTSVATELMARDLRGQLPFRL